jgi:GAF domain-containing protein
VEKAFLTMIHSHMPTAAVCRTDIHRSIHFYASPLFLDGNTIGLIAAANRKGGYSREQQEDLEAIAPAVMQALQLTFRPLFLIRPNFFFI